MPRNCRRNDAHPTRSIDDVVHQRVRLGILTVAYEARRVDFNFLLDTLSLTGGNLSQHLRVLEEAGLVRVRKAIEARRPRSWVSITAKGRRALLQEMEALRAIVGQVKGPATNPRRAQSGHPSSNQQAPHPGPSRSGPERASPLSAAAMADAPIADAVPRANEAVNSEAVSAVGRWTAIVGMAPALAGRSSRSEPLRRLVVWYEQVAADPELTAPPPVDGMDALVDELTSAISSESFDRLGAARWAVRVAENLVGLRRGQLPGTSPALARVAAVRLELALAAALRQLDGRWEAERTGRRRATPTPSRCVE